MPDPVEITETTKTHLENYVLGHIRETHSAAREVQDVDEYNGARAFGMTYWENLRQRLLQVVVPRESTPFVRLKIAKGYSVAAIDHTSLGLIALHHHRVEPPTYLPKKNSAQALRDRAKKGKDLFGENTRQVAHRLVGIVADPFGDLEEVVVGKMVPTYPNGYRIAHKRKLDLDGGWGTDKGDGDGGSPVGPEPEPDRKPTVTRKKTQEATAA